MRKKSKDGVLTRYVKLGFKYSDEKLLTRQKETKYLTRLANLRGVILNW